MREVLSLIRRSFARSRPRASARRPTREYRVSQARRRLWFRGAKNKTELGESGTERRAQKVRREDPRASRTARVEGLSIKRLRSTATSNMAMRLTRSATKTRRPLISRSYLAADPDLLVCVCVCAYWALGWIDVGPDDRRIHSRHDTLSTTLRVLSQLLSLFSRLSRDTLFLAFSLSFFSSGFRCAITASCEIDDNVFTTTIIVPSSPADYRTQHCTIREILREAAPPSVVVATRISRTLALLAAILARTARFSAYF